MTTLQYQLSILGLASVAGLLALLARRVVFFRACLVCGLAAAAILQLVPGSAPSLRLGLDLSGGTEVSLRLSPDQTRLRTLAEEARDLRRRLEDTPAENPELNFRLADQEAEMEAERANVDRNLDGAVGVIRHRLSGMGLSQVHVVRQGRDRVRVQFPGLDLGETERVLATLERQGRLEFRLIVPRDGSAAERRLYRQVQSLRLTEDTLEAVSAELETETEERGTRSWDWLGMGSATASDGSPKPGRFYLVDRQALLSGDHVVFAHAEADRWKKTWWVNVEFDAEGRKRFEEATRTHRGKQLGIVLDGRLEAAPYIREIIGEGVVDIAGNFNRQQAEQLEVVLRSGALRVGISKETQEHVGPSLGKDSIRKGARALAVGLLAVLAFMWFYYGSAGAVTGVALVLNLVFLLAVLSLLDATLTLPGIAGLILILGMTVDANVLVFERIREETLRGTPLGPAVTAGYEGAFVTIVDASLTTIIAAALLCLLGSDSIRGFALVLMIGLVIGLFCSLVVTRWFLDSLIESGCLTAIRMAGPVRAPAFDFMARCRPALGISLLLLGAGGLTFGVRERAGRNYGMDFTGGGRIAFSLLEPATTAEVRRGIAAGTGASFPDAASALQRYGRAKGTNGAGAARYDRFVVRSQFVKAGGQDGPEKGLQAFEMAVRNGLADMGMQARSIRAAMVGAALAGEMKRKGMSAVLLSMAALFAYMWVRFGFRAAFAAGAILALVHDLGITVGILALADQWGLIDGRIDLKIIAALLTITGYSLNDTIVIYNRIRENCPRGTPSRETVNLSINQSLGRTLVTSLTTLLVVLSLLLFGGTVMRAFAFTLLAGITAGTCSSIFVASPLTTRGMGAAKD